MDPRSPSIWNPQISNVGLPSIHSTLRWGRDLLHSLAPASGPRHWAHAAASDTTSRRVVTGHSVHACAAAAGSSLARTKQRPGPAELLSGLWRLLWVDTLQGHGKHCREGLSQCWTQDQPGEQRR